MINFLQKCYGFIRNFPHWRERNIVAFLLFGLLFNIVLTPPFQSSLKIEAYKPWMGEDIVSEFDFAIHKPEDSIQKEVQQIRKNKTPIYIKDTTIFRKKGHAIPEEIPDFKRNLLLHMLDSIYTIGVVQLENEADIQKIALIRTDFYKEYSIYLHQLLTPTQGTNILLRRFPNETSPSFHLALENLVVPNIKYSDSLTEQEIIRQIGLVSKVYGKIPARHTLVKSGEVLSPQKAEMVATYFDLKNEAPSRIWKWAHFFARWALTLLILSILYIYLRYNRKRIFLDFQKLSLILTVLGLVVSAMGLVKWFAYFFDIAPQSTSIAYFYAVPACIVPIVISSFFDSRTSSICNMVISLIGGVLVQDSAEYVLIQMVVGTVAVYSVRLIQRRSYFFLTLFYVLLSYCISYVIYAYCFSRAGISVGFIHIVLLLLNVAFTVFAYPLTYLLEKLFHMSSAMSYLELLDTDHPLLHRLSMIAPGTFQHSIQVANIAKQVVIEIEGDGLLTYVGALYHDIGKIEQKEYFMENFVEGVNPHMGLTPEESARIILGHVSKGLALAQKYQLPRSIIEFIETHHGTTRIEHFYRMAQQAQTSLNEQDFSYKGPRPNSKETAVVMLADSVEAACRSLKIITPQSLELVINQIIDHKIAQDQLIHSPLTFHDITIIRKALLQQMMSIYHSRILL